MEKVLTYRQLEHWGKETPSNNALYTKTKDGWEIVNWESYKNKVDNVAKSLISLGHKQDECIAIMSNNRQELLFAQLGTVAAGGVPAPIYATSHPDQISYILGHSKARFVFAEDKIQYKKLLDERENILIEKIILMEDVPERDLEWTILFDDFLKLSHDSPNEAEFEKRISSLNPDKPALLIYTSGTTGHPKAVIITHNNLFHTGRTALGRYSLVKTRVVSYLPLSHIAEQVITNVAQLYTGGEVYLCPDMKEAKHYLPVAHPNVFLGVPRVWEKFKQAMEIEFAKAKGLKKKMLNWALKTEFSCFEKQLKLKRPVNSFSRKLANKLVISKIKAKIGLDKLHVAVSGAAPIGVEVQNFFASIGITLFEVYGMSETTGAISSTTPEQPRFGTVGKPFDCLEVKIAEDGEIIAKGPNMSPGYLFDEKNTAELWENGWLHTGDIGKFDEDGNLVITDRKKNLIITAGGKNIAPLPIEQALSSIHGIGTAVVIGDRRKYLVCIMTLDHEMDHSIVKNLGIEFSKISELAENKDFISYIEGKIKEINSNLANYETIKKFHVLANDFSVETGELTPTMKVKRKVVIEKYHDQIEKLYTE